MAPLTPPHTSPNATEAEYHWTLLDTAVPVIRHRKLLVLVPLLVAIATYGLTYLVKPTFTARTSFLPPQQQQSGAASALSSLGALSGFSGAFSNLKSPIDQYVTLVQSVTIKDRIIDHFDLMKVYDEKYRTDARLDLDKNVRVVAGKKDGMIFLEADDTDPMRAAAIANQHVEELRRLAAGLALTEAQQRRVFFEAKLAETRDKLVHAQSALQGSGFSQGALRAEPKAAAEGYARLAAEATAAEVRLQALRRNLAEGAPEVQQQAAILAALRAQLAKTEESTTENRASSPDYVGKYRDFKYQETLFELFSRQYELARLDESREGTLIQVVDRATPPEKKSRPKRMQAALLALFGSFLALAMVVTVRHRWQEAAKNSVTAAKLARLRTILARP